MSPQTFVVLTTILFFFMMWYANTSKRNKILCRYRRINKTLIARFVKMQSRYVVFDGKRHDIVPSCVVFQWYTGGIIHMLFPQWVSTLDFTHESRWPLDPNTLKPVIISPDVRASMNKEEWVKSYAKGFTPPGSKKDSILKEYAPWIAILLVVLVGFYLYNNMAALANQMAIIQNNLNAITK